MASFGSTNRSRPGCTDPAALFPDRRLAVLWLGLVLLLCLPASSRANAPSQAQELFSVQVASFSTLDAALTEYQRLRQRLQPAEAELLRIEYREPHFVLRLGSSEALQPLLDLHFNVKVQVPTAMLLKMQPDPRSVLLGPGVDRIQEFQAARMKPAPATADTPPIPEVARVELPPLPLQVLPLRLVQPVPHQALELPPTPQVELRPTTAPTAPAVEPPSPLAALAELWHGEWGLMTQPLLYSVFCGLAALGLSLTLFLALPGFRRGQPERGRVTPAPRGRPGARQLTFRTPDARSGTPTVARLMLHPSTPRNGLSPESEEILRRSRTQNAVIRENLLQLCAERPFKSVYVTSSTPGEGKTRTAVGLAHSLQEAGYSVLLVDANTRNPALAPLYGLPGSPGLLELLNSTEPRIPDSLHATRHGELFILPLGALPQGQRGNGQRPSLNGLVAELGTGFDLVLLDGLPLNDPFARLVAASCDGVLLVAPWTEPRWHMLKKSVRDIESLGGAVLAVVQNKRDRVLPDFLYRRPLRSTTPSAPPGGTPAPAAEDSLPPAAPGDPPWSRSTLPPLQ